MIRFRIRFLILLFIIHCSLAACGPIQEVEPAVSIRVRRQFSMNFGATHQQDEGTDVTAEAIARLWRSKSGTTEVQGSASYNQHFGGFQGDGKAKISGMLTLTHNY
ncbi:AAEL004833-PA [Aedes aegypti]|uniref:AAEL004833-PA n=1 Tax=Aedes aegypti TaxID=7159 RepID=Q0IFI0_AEDAE|nr:AAEL004833-PA [Aedes aegypti]